MDKRWLGCSKANFRPGRPAGMKPELIVLHAFDGTPSDAALRFSRADSQESFHYLVSARGEVYQYVDESDTAYHAGLVVNPSAALVISRPHTNPNFYSIGIGLEGEADSDLNPEQLDMLATLIREVADRWLLPVDQDHVVTHSAIRPSARCPGASLDVAALLAKATPKENVNSIAAKEILTLSNVNLRAAATLSAPVLRVLAGGSRVKITGFVAGDEVKQNPYWYRNEKGYFFWAGASDRPDPRVLPADRDADTDTSHLPAAGIAVQGLSINRARFVLPPGQYYTDRPSKDLIVLHFTAGTTAKSAFDTWVADPQHVAAPYIVDTDGSIYELFNPVQWAFHLGVKGTNGRHDKRSIAIEIVNAGPLKVDSSHANVLNWWPRNFRTRYCGLGENAKYLKVERTFRTVDYFAAFPLVQIEAVRDLLAYLCDEFSISRHLPPVDRHFKHDLAYFENYTGIASHANFRADKWDIGPAFDWDALQIEHLD